MNIMKRLIALTLALITVLVMAVGCTTTPPDDDPDRFNEQVDKERTQLYVGYYNGGVGLTWLKKAKEEFEKLYPEYQIMIDTFKQEMWDQQLIGSMKVNRQDMYIDTAGDIYEFMSKDLLVDLTDAVTTPLTEFGEDKSIADKMNASLKDYYRTTDGKYYGTPYFEGYHHIIYDMDLFDKYNLWFKDGGGFVSSTSDKKTAGQDGKYGTSDDGLPITYSDFFKMMDRMVELGITPLTWSGQYADSYLTNLVGTLIASYEGDNFKTHFSYNGQVEIIKNKDFVESESKTFVLNDSDVETVTVTPENFSDYMYRTTGKYFASKFAKDLVSNTKYYTYNYAESHTGVQRSYLMSSMLGKPIAMLIEGNWWMNESDQVFKDMASYDAAYAKENRNFGVMTIPKADDGSSAEGNTVSPYSGNEFICVSNFSTKKDIAILFFRFLHTDFAMQIFTEYSGLMRPYDYDLTSVYDSLNTYTKSFVDARANTEYVYRLPTNEEFKTIKEVTNFMQYPGFHDTNVNGNTTHNPIMFFCDNPQYTGKDFFLGLEKRFKDTLPIALK